MLRVLVLAMTTSCLLFTTPALPNDALVQQMEMKLKLQELSRLVYQLAERKAQEAVRETSLYREYVQVQKDYERAVKESKAKQKQEEGAWLKLLKDKDTDIPFEDRWSQAPSGGLSPKETILLGIYQGLAERVREFVEEFTWKIYEEDIRKALTELNIGITRDVEKTIHRSYKKWAA